MQTPASEAALECPMCRRWSPPGSIRCDCGFNFQTHTGGSRRSGISAKLAIQVGLVFLYGSLLGLPWGAVVASLTDRDRWHQRVPLLLMLTLWFGVPAFRRARTRLLLLLPVLFVLNLLIMFALMYVVRGNLRGAV